MALHKAGVDIAVIALLLGHESTSSTDIYLHADTDAKQRALEQIAPSEIPPGRYKPADRLLGFLESL